LSPSTKLPAPKSILLCWGKTKEVILDDPESIHEAWQEFTVRCGRSFPYLRTAVALKRRFYWGDGYRWFYKPDPETAERLKMPDDKWQHFATTPW